MAGSTTPFPPPQGGRAGRNDGGSCRRERPQCGCGRGEVTDGEAMSRNDHGVEEEGVFWLQTIIISKSQRNTITICLIEKMSLQLFISHTYALFYVSRGLGPTCRHVFPYMDQNAPSTRTRSSCPPPLTTSSLLTTRRSPRPRRPRRSGTSLGRT
jgi:hypothetical protein